MVYIIFLFFSRNKMNSKFYASKEDLTFEVLFNNNDDPGRSIAVDLAAR